jgi:hypothetical protein
MYKVITDQYCSVPIIVLYYMDFLTVQDN